MKDNETEMDALNTREAELVRELEEIKRTKEAIPVEGRTFRAGNMFLRATRIDEEGDFEGRFFFSDGDCFEVGPNSFVYSSAQEIPEAEFLAAWTSFQNALASMEM